MSHLQQSFHQLINRSYFTLFREPARDLSLEYSAQKASTAIVVSAIGPMLLQCDHKSNVSCAIYLPVMKTFSSCKPRLLSFLGWRKETVLLQFLSKILLTRETFIRCLVKLLCLYYFPLSCWRVNLFLFMSPPPWKGECVSLLLLLRTRNWKKEAPPWSRNTPFPNLWFMAWNYLHQVDMSSWPTPKQVVQDWSNSASGVSHNRNNN